jgi:hypothetical protein
MTFSTYHTDGGIWEIVVPDTDRAFVVQTGTSTWARQNMEHAAEYGIARADFTHYAGVLAVWTTIQGRGIRFLRGGCGCSLLTSCPCPCRHAAVN